METKELIEIAQGLCADTPRDSEYVRGQAELLCEVVGMSTEHKDVMIAAITERG
jgi:hypothetical protein